KGGQIVDLDPAVAEDLDGGFAQRVGNQNLGCHVMLLSGQGATALPAFLLSENIPGVRGQRPRLRQPCADSSVRYAHSIQGVSAATSAASTVEPHQIRSPGGASR